MVNSIGSTKYKVLEILRSNNSTISGETIANQTGVSRVSIWKAIQSLQSSGYEISSNRNGYHLDKDYYDSLFPWEFGNNENQFTHFTKTESTMIEARHIAESEKEIKVSSSHIITADEQTNGHGHDNHTWTTTKGSLAYTIITRNKIPTAASHRITMASQVALVNTLSKISNKRFFVRWPNDIWSEKGKVGGILDEISALGSICQWINIGIGVNVSQKPDIPYSDCIAENGNIPTRKEILSLFWKEFIAKEKIALENTNELATEWNSLCYDRERKITFLDNKKVIFNEINNWGWAKVSSSKSKNQELIPPGEKSFIKTIY